MDRLIRETLSEKAEEVEVPAGAWKQVRSQLRPAPWWRRYRIGARVEMVAAVAALLLIAVLGAQRSGPVDLEAVTPPIPVVEQRIADSRSIGENLLQLARLRPAPTMSEAPLWKTVQEANTKLEPFGYRVELSHIGQSFDLHQGEQLLLGGLMRIGPVTVNARGDDFIMLASQDIDQHWLVRATGPQEWDRYEYMEMRYQPPVYVGNDLVAVRWDDKQQVFVVWRGEEPVLTIPPADQYSGNMVKGLHAWSGHWVLELLGRVYIDGRSLNEELGYDEIFQWQLVNGKPFFFFRKGKQFGISYDGQVLPQRYDEIPHYLCCEPTILNPGGNQFMVSFYGRRGRDWYWVEVGQAPSELEALRGQVRFPVFVPARVPEGMQLVSLGRRDRLVEIIYAGLHVLNGPAGCCLDADPRKTGELVELRGGLTGHFLPNQPEFGGPILWWVEEGAYVALSGPYLTR